MELWLALTLSAHVRAAGFVLPDEQGRRQMVSAVASEMERLDGDGFLSREIRPVSWESTVQMLNDEASSAKDLHEFGRVFRRLDAAYPNLHARVLLNLRLDEQRSLGQADLPFRFVPESADELFVISKMRIVNAHSEGLADGDEVLEINNEPISEWTAENFNFCKFPLRSQCELVFQENFQGEILGWTRTKPLTLKVRHEGKDSLVTVQPTITPFRSRPKLTSANCGVEANRYEGFRLVHEGQHLCAFEKDATLVVRIRSFYYEEGRFAHVDEEVNAFWSAYWHRSAARVNTLILDVIDNYGGESPTPYYDIFFNRPYQEEYVRFKKISEIERPDILQSLFWGDPGKEIWWKSIHRDGSYAAVPFGGFLEPIPQFCASDAKDCREGLFEPRNNGFQGEVRVLTNQWCISSCVGFLYGLKTFFGARMQIYGMPDSGDSAYSRLSIFAEPGRSSVEGLDAQGEPWVRQIVTVTRSTGPDGTLLSGQPQTVDHWISRGWNQSDADWAKEVFESARP